MALLHDWAETPSVTCPKQRRAYFGTDARKLAETAAFADVVSGAAPRRLSIGSSMRIMSTQDAGSATG